MIAALQEIFPRLLQVLTGPDYDLRRVALIALSKLRGQTAADLLLERFQSDNLEDYLTLAISRLPPEKASRILITALNDPNLEARLNAAEALVQQKSDDALFALNTAVENFLNKTTDEQQAPTLLSEDAFLSAIRALGQIANPMCVSSLRKIILKNTSPRIRATAVATLGEHMQISLVPMYQALLKDPDARVRANAIEALQLIEKPSIIGMLQPYLYDSHQRVRANAVKAIWKYGDYEVSTTLKEMLGDADKKQKVSGIYAIGEIRIELFAKNLLAFLKSPDADIRRNAVVALKKFGKKDYSLELVPLLQDSVPEVRIQAASAVFEVFQATALDPLLKQLLVETQPAVRTALITHVGKTGNPQAIQVLKNYLEDHDERVIAATLEAIFRVKPQLPSPATIRSFLPFLQSGFTRLRSKAIRILWNWGCEEVFPAILTGMNSPQKGDQVAAIESLGEVFAEMSNQGGEMLLKAEEFLVAAVAKVRQDLTAKLSSENQDRVAQLWNQVADLIQKSQWSAAQPHLESLLALSPRHLQGLLAMGDLFFRDGNLAQAESFYTRALENSPNTVKAHYSLGQIYHRRKEWDKTVAALQTALKLYPKLPQAYLMLADAFENLNRLPEAREVMKHLQVLVPQNAGILDRNARLALATGSIGEAISLARNALACGTVSPVSQAILAVGEFLSGNHSQAFTHSWQALGSVAERPDPRTILEIRTLMKLAQDLLAKKGG